MAPKTTTIRLNQPDHFPWDSHNHLDNKPSRQKQSFSAVFACHSVLLAVRSGELHHPGNADPDSLPFEDAEALVYVVVEEFDILHRQVDNLGVERVEDVLAKLHDIVLEPFRYNFLPLFRILTLAPRDISGFALGKGIGEVTRPKYEVVARYGESDSHQKRKYLITLSTVIVVLIIVGSITSGVLVSRQNQRDAGEGLTDSGSSPDSSIKTNINRLISTGPIIRQLGRQFATALLNDGNPNTNKTIENYLYIFQLAPQSNTTSIKTFTYTRLKILQDNTTDSANHDKLEDTNNKAVPKQIELHLPAIPNSPIAIIGQQQPSNSQSSPEDNFISDIFYLHLSPQSNNITDIAHLRILCSLSLCTTTSTRLMTLTQFGQTFTIDPKNPSLAVSLLNTSSRQKPNVEKSIWLYYRTIDNEIVASVVRSTTSGDQINKENSLNDLRLFFIRTIPKQDREKVFDSSIVGFIGGKGVERGHFLFSGSGSGIYLVWWNESSHYNNFGSAHPSGFRDDLPSKPDVVTM
ncbi:hypothetical protein QBC38DRAFT_505531, partial [Podospora fimiseda]